ncbi:ribose 5-phosphate isomerase b, putative [Ichthyophthirius multifiliis]|uniref:Ribose 5-phosphate isomerase b, putative n=1 Tax=Ichthyophthirius multifiliis TaxID=5932 RepID=G0QS36_ICHMU|nr:ribose 5-phosphate isomerase b, putative [Ichthyophthirius multifiliis]EGR31978.1 ribose 5-phosphate isomerase b, putative [Ichthyophthirius multifiliis]|eukprot:XP_004035464.1 ribose 5-phosphate isomerase b, putative [Ichthyophthirius multifiliis]
MQVLTVYVGSDHAGFQYKNELIKYIQNELKFKTIDCGTDSQNRCDYPDFALKVCSEVLKNQKDTLGVLVCGSGIGISMSANKLKGIRCALCHDYYSAKYARENLNCNVVAMGERVIGIDVAKQLVEVFLKGQYQKNNDNELFLNELAKLEEQKLQ